MPFHVALDLTIKRLFVKVLTPNFAYELPFRIPWLSNQLEEARDAFASLKGHMEVLVTAARSSDNDEGADLLRCLVKANDATRSLGGASTKGTLTDDELFSNIFVFLLAGHETSAHTLSFAILLLALNPDVQKKLRKEVLRVWPTVEDCASSSSKRDFEKLEYTLAVFRETLRCFPAEPRINKIVEQDSVLQGVRFEPSNTPHETTTSYDGALTNIQFNRDETKDRKFAVRVSKGSAVSLDIWALHMNPLYWGNDADLFKPERFIDIADYKWPRDAFMPFSSGARGCLGQRFSITESVCLLACFVRGYEILPPEEGMKAEKLSESDKRRILSWKAGITLTPTNAYVRLRRYSNEE
ncbi:cytochrome P450 [Fomitiporia mediterranea MF3/22]|uniref:cytochrome P450 n=1 Tax=Fomitiporia mediterranea (strain MF3/22) TaxID=694068 RepID=UPI0004408F57|nr:cytochrome P450 [Fomitiporia mediterranea MF3/22]EJC99088.1 cytochrome P450 [Fomitiporia mediterranea MF3/22]